jgi:hypothetical protein
MQKTSETYKRLIGADHTIETRLTIGEPGVLITKKGESITFGGLSILVGISGADGGYDESMLMSMETDSRVFGGETLSVGDCISAQLDVEMIKPTYEIQKSARLVPYVRLSNGVEKSEWIQKGVFYVDTRSKKEDGSAIEKIILHGYDDMLKAEQDYPASKLSWPAKDIDVVQEVANFIGVAVDQRTVAMMTDGFRVQYPGEYSCRETLGYIASMYGGCFVMSEIGELRLVAFWDIPPETRYLIAAGGYAITFGGVRIIV